MWFWEPWLFALAAAAQGKDSFTPMALDAGFGPMDISAPATPPEQIISKFAAKESRVPGGAEPLHLSAHRPGADDGRRQQGGWRVVRGGRRDLRPFRHGARRRWCLRRRVRCSGCMMSPSDLQDIQHGYPFVLTDGRGGRVQHQVRGPAEGGRGRLLRLRREPQDRLRRTSAISTGASGWTRPTCRSW